MSNELTPVPSRSTLVSTRRASTVQKHLDEFANRNDSQDLSLVGPSLYLPRNLLTMWFKQFRVKKGIGAVILVDGKYYATIGEGAYNYAAFPLLSNFPFLPRIELIPIVLRERSLEYPRLDIPFLDRPMWSHEEIRATVSVGIVVHYQIVKPEATVLEIEDALRKLRLDILNAVRKTVNAVSYRDYLLNTNVNDILTMKLQNSTVGSEVGIQMTHVGTTYIGASSLYDQVYQAIVDAVVKKKLAEVELTPSYVLTHHAELFTSLFGDKALTDSKLIDALITVLQLDPTKAVKEFRDLMNRLTTPTPMTSVEHTPGKVSSEASIGGLLPNLQETLEKECVKLVQNGVIAYLLPLSGGHRLQVELVTAFDNKIDISFDCSDRYPTEPPSTLVKLNGEVQSCSLDWSSNQSIAASVEVIRRRYS